MSLRILVLLSIFWFPQNNYAQKLVKEKVSFDYIRRPPYPVVPDEKKVRMELFGSEGLAPETDSASFLRGISIQGIQNDRYSPEFVIRFHYKDNVINTIVDISDQQNKSTSADTTKKYRVDVSFTVEVYMQVLTITGDLVWTKFFSEASAKQTFTRFRTRVDAQLHIRYSDSFQGLVSAAQRKAITRVQNSICKVLDERYGYLPKSMDLDFRVLIAKDGIIEPKHQKALFYTSGGFIRLIYDPRVGSRQWLDTAVNLWAHSLNRSHFSPAISEALDAIHMREADSMSYLNNTTYSAKSITEVKVNIFWCLVFADRFDQAQNILNEIRRERTVKSGRLKKMADFMAEYRQGWEANNPSQF
jgi:hypothetical protein